MSKGWRPSSGTGEREQLRGGEPEGGVEMTEF